MDYDFFSVIQCVKSTAKFENSIIRLNYVERQKTHDFFKFVNCWESNKRYKKPLKKYQDSAHFECEWFP